MTADPGRRRLLLGAAGLLVTSVVPLPLHAVAVDLDHLYGQRFGDRRPTPGGVRLDVARVVENGNSVAVSVAMEDDAADPPPSALYLLMPRNPEPWGLRYGVQPPAVARFSTRIRLAGTQNLTAVAEWPDGRLRATAVSVLVTLGACIDDDINHWVRP